MPTTENKQNLKQIHDGPYISLMRASPRFLGALPATVVAAALILPATLPTAAGAATPPAAAVSTAAAIGGNSGGAAPRSDPNDEADLRDTISALTTTSHNVAMTTPISTIKGSVDPAAKAAAIVATSGDLEVDEVVDDGQVWLKMDLGKDANSQLGISGNDWMALDPQKLSANNNLPIHADASDPIDMAGILAGVADAKRVDDTTFTGHLDLTKVSGHNTPDPDEVAQAGAAATATPFTVTTDDQGRILRFTVDTSGFDPGLGVAVDYSDYGAADPISDPASSSPAPDSVYSVFN